VLTRKGLAAGIATVALSALPALGAGQTSSGQAYRESVPGTLVSFDMVPVPGGTVTVDGRPVTVAPFHISRTEVTWDLYDVFALGLDVPKTGKSDAVARPSQPYGAPDHGWGHAGYPAISIASTAAQAFCEWLSAKTGKTYRLATEAEWMHAARLAAGAETLSPAQRDELAWHRENAEKRTHPVGTKKPDALGLVDLFGNAAEWVTTSNGKFVTRGGSFRDPGSAVGPSARAEQDDSWNERDPQLPKSRWWLSDGPFVGFRLVEAGR
jgi:formylglycine-generating enzyme required for sulfatase activity